MADRVRFLGDNRAPLLQHGRVITPDSCSCRFVEEIAVGEADDLVGASLQQITRGPIGEQITVLGVLEVDAGVHAVEDGLQFVFAGRQQRHLPMQRIGDAMIVVRALRLLGCQALQCQSGHCRFVACAAGLGDHAANRLKQDASPIQAVPWQGNMPEQRSDAFRRRFAQGEHHAFDSRSEFGQQRIGRLAIRREQNNDARQKFAFAENPGRESWRWVVDQAEVFWLRHDCQNTTAT